LRDDYYSFDSKNYALVGENSQNVLRLGDEVIVRLKKADLERKQIDFEFVSTAEEYSNQTEDNK
jgi:exoribonuclease R